MKVKCLINHADVVYKDMIFDVKEVGGKQVCIKGLDGRPVWLSKDDNEVKEFEIIEQNESDMDTKVTWQTLEDIDPTFSGYAWISFQNEYSEGKPWWAAKMCRIWTHQTSKTKWWTGWDLERNEALNLSWAPCRVIILDKPESP